MSVIFSTTCHVTNSDKNYKLFVLITLLYNYILKCYIMLLESDFIHISCLADISEFHRADSNGSY